MVSLVATTVEEKRKKNERASESARSVEEVGGEEGREEEPEIGASKEENVFFVECIGKCCLVLPRLLSVPFIEAPTRQRCLLCAELWETRGRDARGTLGTSMPKQGKRTREAVFWSAPSDSARDNF